MHSPLVTIEEGRLRGCQKTNLNGEKFHSFLGIPYAKPPIGELRFKAPVPIEPWNGIKEAITDGDSCYQRNTLINAIEGSENCLHLSVYTKNLPGESKSLKPVMVWFYGGGFVDGSNSSKLYGPEFLLTEDIVLVTVNYRLGYLGFLQLKDVSLDVPGNAGLKDQRLGLKWVQRNIKNFNGDPQNVTIFGESAGSASTHYHILSSASKGLFHKAILQSGCSLNPWATVPYNTIEFAKTIKENVSTEKEALDILRSLPVEELLSAQDRFAGGSIGIAGPTIEPPSPTAVITSPPAELLANGQYNKVPIIIGYNDREGLLLQVHRNLAAAARKDAKVDSAKLDLSRFLPPGVSSEDPKGKMILKAITETYLQGLIAEDKFALASDFYFIAGIIAAAKLHAKTSQFPVYCYRISLDAGLNINKKVAKITEKGTCHGDELGYLFNIHLLASITTRGVTEEKAIRDIVRLWTNFAKTSNPTPEGNDLNTIWKPFDENELNYLDIGTKLTPLTDPEPKRIKLWEQISKFYS